jgi:hypothetical protein
MYRTYEIVEKLAVNEEKVMELYSVFGDKFSEYRQFWKDISEEEKMHAQLLRDFGSIVDDRDIKLNLGYINMESLDKSISLLDSEITRARNGGMDIKQAFRLARTLEKGIIESDCFRVFDTGVKDLVKLFGALESDTKRHGQMMDEKCSLVCGD